MRFYALALVLALSAGCGPAKGSNEPAGKVTIGKACKEPAVDWSQRDPKTPLWPESVRHQDVFEVNLEGGAVYAVLTGDGGCHAHFVVSAEQRADFMKELDRVWMEREMGGTSGGHVMHGGVIWPPPPPPPPPPWIPAEDFFTTVVIGANRMDQVNDGISKRLAKPGGAK